MEYILKHFEDTKKQWHNHEYADILGPMVNSGWYKFTKYYQLTDETHAYAAAVVLHPRRKWQWLTLKWDDDWVSTAKQAVQHAWDIGYKPLSTELEKSPPRRTNDFLLDLDADDWACTAPTDEYTAYCATPPVITNDPILWWQEEAQRTMYPNLSNMALDYLSIPAMAAEPERVFSSCKVTLSDRRNRMGAELLEALECLKSWLKISSAEADIVEGIMSSGLEEERDIA